MICHLCERALFMHAHGELDGIQRFLLQCHLEGCDECRARWAKSVVEKDQLRRALSPVPTLDPEGERRLQIIGARIRAEQRPPGGPVVAPMRAPVAVSPAGRGRMAGLALVAALLAIALTAMAAVWAPSLTSTEGRAAPPQVPLGQCFSTTHCPNCAASHAPAAPTPGGAGCSASAGNAPGSAKAAVGQGATGTVPLVGGAACPTAGAVGSASRPEVEPISGSAGK